MPTTTLGFAEGSEASDRAGTRTAAAVLVLVALSWPLFFAGLGRPALSDPDEPYYAVPALEMMRNGSWSLPIFRGQPWFDKPILYYAVVRVAYHVFGVSEFAARVGSALAALAGILAVFSIGRRLGMGREKALASAVILGSSLGYVFMARAAVTDMTLTAMITLGMLAVVLYLSSGSPIHAGWAGVAFGLAVLTKGPVGIIVPGIALAAYALVARRRDRVTVKGLLAGLAGLVVSAGPWFGYMAWFHRDLLVDTFLVQGNLGRFVEPEHGSFAFYYPAVLAVGLLPWSGGLPAALGRAVLRRNVQAETGPGGRPGRVFLLCWFGAVFGVFSLSASKLPSYLLPLCPPAALLLGGFWWDAVRGRVRRWITIGSLVLVVLFTAVTVAVLGVATVRHEWTTLPAFVGGLSACLVLASILAAVAAARGRMAAFFTVQVGSTLAVLAVLLTAIVPRLEPWDSTRPLVRQLERRGLAGEVVGTYHIRDVSLDYYLGRDVPRIEEVGALEAAVTGAPGGIWIMRIKDVAKLAAGGDLRAEPICQDPRRSAVRLSGSPEVPGRSS